VTDEDGAAMEKRALERRMAKARGSIDATVSEIKETVDSHVQGAKDMIEGVSDFREQFASEPVVWSLGALAAGFAVGYALGSQTGGKGKGRKASSLGGFADAVVEELSTVGNDLVMPRLQANIKQLFGVDFASLLADMKGTRKPRRKTNTKPPGRRRTSQRTKSISRRS